MSKIRLNQVIRKHFPYISEIRHSDKTTFEHVPLQRLIMLDRYSLKDFALMTLEPGDVVVVTIKDDPKFPQRGYGEVESIVNGNVTVKLDVAFLDGETITRPLAWVDKPLELSIEQIARRVARGVAEAEDESIRAKVEAEFYELIASTDLVPAGRINFGAGNIAKVTWINCFVIPSPRDSRAGIMDHAKEHAEIMAMSGGVGSNMSTLRPKHARVASVNGHSSGAVSWMNYVSQLTHLIQQGGSRRGAQMKCLNDTHPEVILFAMSKIQNPDRLRAIAHRWKDYPEIAETALSLIDSKDTKRVVDPNFLTGANISVLLSDEFMEAVRDSRDWTFLFPDIDNYSPEAKKRYDEEWHTTGGDVLEWKRKTGLALKEYGKMPAKVLYEFFSYCAWGSAEPGALFAGTIQKMSNCRYYALLIATNPCGEQPLPAYGMCTLSHINFANMYDAENDDVDWERFKRAIHGGVRFLDDVITQTPLPLPEIEKMATGERRIGLGILGKADLFIKLRLPYGSDEMLAKDDQIMRFFRDESYRASIELAKAKGPFPFFDAEKYLEMGFIKTLPADIQYDIGKHGTRNVCVNTVAPTGTTGSMHGVGTGLEPYYAFEYFRSGRMGEFMPVKVAIAQEWLDANGKKEISDLPPWFVSAQDLTPQQHAAVQAIVQKYIDSACSKTCNAPNSMTVEETADLYMKAWEMGLKGVTIYRDGSRFEAVLTTKAEITKDENEADAIYMAELSHAHEEEFDEAAMDSTKVCTIRYENGQRIVECGTE